MITSKCPKYRTMNTTWATLQLKTDLEEVGFEGFFSKVEGEAPVTPCRLRCFALASGGQ